jgi:5-methylcytosine-specific restriction endonuclease McrA
MCLTCCDCGQAIQRQGKSGRLPRRCKKCREESERQRLCCRSRRRPQHTRKQRASRKQTVVLQCANATCRKPFETTAARAAKGHRFCRRECSYPPARVCQNPACERPFRRRQCTNNPWKGKGLYCCRDCYADHRFGADRPRLKRSLSAMLSASAHALARSLRKRCKQFGVTFDPACTREAVLARDNYVCQKCHIKCNNEYRLHPKTRTPHLRNAEHDHIVPLSVPGSPGNVFENSQCLCRRCNAKKGNTPDGQLRLCLEEEAWESGVRVRRQRSSKSLEATPAAAL